MLQLDDTGGRLVISVGLPRSVGITLFYPAWGSINAIESAGGADDTQVKPAEELLQIPQFVLAT